MPVDQSGPGRREAVATAGDFYAKLVPLQAFAALTDPEHYRPLPADWVVGLGDVVHSTQAIADGRYKAVNIVGAAVLAAVTNALPEVRFPFVFGGDGASLAIPRDAAPVVHETLARTAAWAEDSLALILRVALIPVSEIRTAGFDVRIARYAASRDVSYAMFSGGGLAWAEARVKQGRFAIHRAGSDAAPDLSGLYCGFAPIRSRRGVILSMIALPVQEGPPFAALVTDILALLDGNGHAGRPLPDEGPLPAWMGSGLEESIAGKGASSGPFARAATIWDAIKTRLILAAGIPVGAFDPVRYRRQLVDNTDFRKFDDGLKMTVDVTPAVGDAIEARLAAAQAAGICRSGTHRQTSANLTCFVPSRIRADHVHFVDGATGGYAAAAAKLKADGSRESAA